MKGIQQPCEDRSRCMHLLGAGRAATAQEGSGQELNVMSISLDDMN